MNRILAAITPVRVAFLTVGLVIGVFSGATAAGVPQTRTPIACHAMASNVTEIFDLWTSLTGAVRERGDALDKDTYRIHDAEVNHLLASLDAVGPKYDAAKAACLGMDR